MNRHEQIRWTSERAASEFGPAPKTITRNLRVLGINPGPDGKWSTQEIARAIYGDLAGEKLRETRGRADKYELEVKKLRGELVPSQAVEEIWEDGMMQLRQAVRSSGMSHAEIDAAFKNMRAVDGKRILERVRERGMDMGQGDNTIEATAEPDSKPVGRRVPRSKQRSKQ